MNIKEYFRELRFSPAHHLGAGDIRLTMGQQEEIEAELEAMNASRDQARRFAEKYKELGEFSRAELDAEREKVATCRHALNLITGVYCDLINSGDAGFWNPEGDHGVIVAREALEETK